MGNPLDYTRLAGALVKLVVTGAGAYAGGPALPVIVPAIDAVVEWAGLKSKNSEQKKLVKVLAKRFEECLERPSKTADPQELAGALTQVQRLVEKLADDNTDFLEALRHPEAFENRLLADSRCVHARKDLAEEACGFFNELVRLVARFYVEMVRTSPDLVPNALAEILRDTSEIKRGVDANGEKLDAVIEQNETILEQMAIPVSALPTVFPERLIFGSRPRVSVGAIDRPEVDTLWSLISEDAAAATVLSGMRGVGKSQIATAIAQQCIDEGWATIIWVDAASRQSILDAWVTIAENELGISPDGKDAETIAQEALRRLEALAEAGRLLVLDNAENADDLRDLIPRGGGFRTIITSTKEFAGFGRLIEIRCFTPDQAKEYLLKQIPFFNESDLVKLVEELGYHPLALSQAAVFINRRKGSLSVENYLELMKTRGINHALKRIDGSSYPTPVGRALRLAYSDALDSLGSEPDDSLMKVEIGQRLLGALSLMREAGVPREWLCYLDHTADLVDDVIDFLADAHICDLSEDGHEVRIHRLLGTVIREDWPADSDEGRRSADSVGLVLSRVTIGDHESERQKALDLVEQVRSLGQQEYSRRLFERDGVVLALAESLHHATALGVPLVALSLADAVVSMEPLLGSSALGAFVNDGLASAYESAGDLRRAIPLYEETLTQREEILGPTHPDTLTSRNNLAYAYQAAGDLHRAIPLFEDNLRLARTVLAPGTPALAIFQRNLEAAKEESARRGDRS